jgi:uncharacterized membrane protein
MELAPRTLAPPRIRARAETRIASIDVLRGLVMALMALDHVRDYFAVARCNPLDLSCTDPALFFTRWITHYCAPVFVLLAGVGAGIAGGGMSRSALRRFLVTRGLWLVLLEVTVVQFVWTFNVRYESGLVLQVIWALGASMVALAVVVGLPRHAIGLAGLAMVCGHDLLDGIAPGRFGAWAPLWNVLHVQGPTPFGLVLYPLVPWVGVMMLGWWLADLFARPAAERRRDLLTIGGAAVYGFVGLRLANLYGDPTPWSSQATPTLTVLSFLNVAKYPPSLCYLLVTLGPALIVLALLDRARGRVADALATLGRVPLFFYVLHLAAAHLAAGLVALAMGFGTAALGTIFLHFPKGWGFGLPGVYVAWVVVLAITYPACAWFAGVKRRRTDWWLVYL